MTSEDKRNPLARARDEWLDGKECRMLMDLTCGDLVTQDSKYIRNRFERAFLAGAAAQEKIDLENCVISSGQLLSFKNAAYF